MMQGQILLKGKELGGVGVGVGEEEGGSTFPPSFFQGLSILIIESTLLFAKLCYVFFSSTITL